MMTSLGVEDRWAEAFRRYGVVPHQSPVFAGAGAPLAVVDGGSCLSAFEVHGRVARCFMQGAACLPLGGDALDGEALLARALGALSVDVVHLPLLYEDIRTAMAFASVPGCARLARRPSPVVGWSLRGGDVWPRCEARLGSRARRRRRRFERAGLETRTLSGEDAVCAVSRIEARSWKATAGQDMHRRGQLWFYVGLVRSGVVETRVVCAGDEPVAYRMDVTVGRTVFCLKWSFDERFRAASPGFYLIAVDLPEFYGGRDVEVIDLFGAPDALKDAVSSGSRPRFDVAWPAGPAADAVLAERAEHDRAAVNAYHAGRGIRASYQTPDHDQGDRWCR